MSARLREAFRLGARGVDRLALGVSGGSDSLSLLVLAAELRPAKIELHAVTVDHGLRPEARAEAAYVGEVCERLGVAHAVLRWKRDDDGPVGQAEARRARHDLLARWAKRNGHERLALAHTRDDRVETFLMRARQGSGWHGLAGPLPFAPSPVWPEGMGLTLVRPLLAFGREELRGELRRRGVAWVDDPSNSAPRYERVRMRRLIAGLDRASYAKAVKAMDRLAQMRAAVAAEARGALDLLAVDGDVALLPVERVKALGVEARLRLVEAMVLAAGGAAGPLRRDGLERLAARIAEDALAAGVTLAGTLVRLRTGKSGGMQLCFSQAAARKGTDKPASGPSWRRAEFLLQDPGIGLLGL